MNLKPNKMPFDFEKFLTEQVASGSPDAILIAREPPAVRRRAGNFEAVARESLAAADVLSALQTLAGEAGVAEFTEKKEYELGFERPALGRFRATFFETLTGPALALRHIPFEIPTPAQLGIPQEIQDLALRHDGLILVTGPNGHGKTTTLASLVQHINTHRAAHIITIEDPIEFVYHRDQSFISQRGVGQETHTFGAAIRHTLRQNVDVIVVGEMRDLETIATAMTLAETGHLVLATLHTHDAPRTVQRIIDVFPAGQQQQIALQLSHSLAAVMSQRLIPTADGIGRVAAREILIANDGVRHAIRERKISELYSQIQINREAGMIPFDESLLRLVSSKQITPAQALLEAHDARQMRSTLAELNLYI